MESQPQNPEFRINPENFYPCVALIICMGVFHWVLVFWSGSWCPF